MGSRSKQFNALTALKKWEKLHKRPMLSEEFLHQIKRNIAYLKGIPFTPRKEAADWKQVEAITNSTPKKPFYVPLVKAVDNIKNKLKDSFRGIFRGPRKVGV